MRIVLLRGPGELGLKAAECAKLGTIAALEAAVPNVGIRPVGLSANLHASTHIHIE